MVKTSGRDMDEPSRGSFKLRVILSYMSRKGRTLTRDFVDLCAGAGGWSSVMHDLSHSGTAISFWGMHEKHAQWKGPKDVNTITGDIGLLKPVSANIILCDGGESDQNADAEGKRHAKLLQKVLTWMKHNVESDFVIKVLAPYHVEVLKVLEEIQQLTGKGRLLRMRASRLSSTECYFVSLPSRQLHREAYSLMMYLISSWKQALRNPPEERQLDYVERTPQWDQPEHYAGVPRLKPFDMLETMAEIHGNRTIYKPRNITRFLKETGYFIVKSVGSNSSIRNTLISKLLGPVITRKQGLSDWKMTSTTARATFMMS